MKRVLVIIAVAVVVGALLLLFAQDSVVVDVSWKVIAVVIAVVFGVIVGIFIVRLIRHRQVYGRLPQIVFETNGSDSTKHDKAIEKWFKERSEKELVLLHTFITDEGAKGVLLSQAFGWTARECEELSNMEVAASDAGKGYDVLAKMGKLADAQMTRILRYMESGICVRCRKPLSGIIKEVNRKGEADVDLTGCLFLSVHERTGLCVRCIGEFLLDRMGECGSHV